jgi:glutamate dehydrogenase/leucine dehydrogenase
MEVKFTVSGPAIGGAKSGINFDPNDPRKKAFYNVGTKVSPLLKSYYGTGGDLNVDEIHEVIPMTEECGGIRKKESLMVSNLLKQTKLIELVNYVKVWLK